MSETGQPWWLWAVGAACVLSIGWTLTPRTEPQARSCDRAAAYLEEAFGAEEDRELRRVGVATEALEQARASAAQWRRERAEVCHGAASGALHPGRWSARRGCLERWAERFVAEVDIAGSGVVSPSVFGITMLSPSACRSASVGAPLPADPQRLARALSGRQHLSRGEVWLALGNRAEARRELETAGAEFEAVGPPGLAFEAELWRRVIDDELEAGLVDLAGRATAAGEDRTAARALSRAVLLHRRRDPARPVDPTLRAWAQAAMERTDDDLARGWWLLAAGDDEAARLHLEAALGPHHAGLRDPVP